jgi:hypothetical protein
MHGVARIIASANHDLEVDMARAWNDRLAMQILATGAFEHLQGAGYAAGPRLVEFLQLPGDFITSLSNDASYVCIVCVVMLRLMSAGFAPTTYAEGRKSDGALRESTIVRVPQIVRARLHRSRWSAVIAAICQASRFHFGLEVDLRELNEAYTLDWVELPERATHLRRIAVNQSHVQVIRESQAARGKSRVVRVVELIVLSMANSALSSNEVWARCESFRETGEFDCPGASTFGTRSEYHELSRVSEFLPVCLLLAPVHMVHCCVTCKCIGPGMVISDVVPGTLPAHDHSGNARRYLRNQYFVKRRYVGYTRPYTSRTDSNLNHRRTQTAHPFR